VETPDGVVIFVDLTAKPVDNVTILLTNGSTVDVKPYRMPRSRSRKYLEDARIGGAGVIVHS